MSVATLGVRGIGAWATGLPDWQAMRAFARGETQVAGDAPKKPAPTLLPPNERRRAPDSVLLALQVAQAACDAAGADPAALPSIFASTHGDLAITDATCRTLAEVPTDISPTRFHNSVHNAASGYWTIGVGSHAASTAISAYRATFAQGLLEAAMQLHAGAARVLLVAYDSAASGPLAAVSSSEGLLGFALVLESVAAEGIAGGSTGSARTGEAPGRLSLSLALQPGTAPAPADNALWQLAGRNAMSPVLALVDAIANQHASCALPAGQDLILHVELSHG